MIKRIAEKKLLELARGFKAVAVTGPRQTGKTTLVKSLFPEKPYLSLENPDTRQFAMEDPRGFLKGLPNGAILDEVQRTPEIFSYLQEILDNTRTPGSFILTGSNNFLLQQHITQSLAGRVGYLNLLPFSVEELNTGNWLPSTDDEFMLKGCYPPLYDQGMSPSDWCSNHIRTYIERDVRQIKNISDLIQFEKFFRLIAGRSGQELNHSAIAVEAGIDVKTVQSWIGILESSFIIHLLPPFYNNYNKTIVKRPKLYLLDTALLCHLLGIHETTHLTTHPLRGAIFETMIISELVKSRTHRGLPLNLYFWRDKTGHEIDVIMRINDKILPVEIKSGQTIIPEFFKNLNYWRKLSGVDSSLVLYGGQAVQERSDGTKVIPWRKWTI